MGFMCAGIEEARREVTVEIADVEAEMDMPEGDARKSASFEFL